MNEPYRLRYANQIVGIFLLVILAFLSVLVVLFLRTGEFFTKKDNFWLEIAEQDVGDLSRGAEVLILGQHAGNVEDIRYAPDGNRVRIDLGIHRNMRDEIFTDSVVRMERKFGLGTPILVIQRAASSDAPHLPLPVGSRIPAFRGEADRIDQMAKEVESVSESVRLIQQKLDPTLTGIDDAALRFRGSLDQTVDPAFERTRQAFDSFLKTNEAVRPDAVETMQVIRAATENLDRRIVALTETISRLVENDMRDTLGKVRESTSDVSAAARSVNDTSQDVNQDIAASLAKIDAAAEQVKVLAEETREVVRIVRQEARDLTGTTARVNDTLDDTQDMVEEIRSHWLLRRYSKQTSTTPAISPSVIRGGSVR